MQYEKGERGAIAVAALMVGVSVMFLNISPMVTGVVVDSFGFSNAQAGQLVGIPLFAMAFVNFTQVFWIRSVRHWRLMLWVSISLMMLGYIGAAYLSAYEALMVCYVFLGAAIGAVYGASMTLISDSHDPDRGFGGAQLAQVVISAPLMIAIPAVIVPAYGFPGLMLSLAALPFMCLFLVRLIPDEGLYARVSSLTENDPLSVGGVMSTQGGSLHSKLATWCTLLAVVFFMQGYTGLWVFIERIGVERGLESTFIGSMLAITGVVGGCSALIPIVLGDRFGRLIPTTAGVLLFSISAVLLDLAGDLSFIIACIFQGVSYAVCAPYIFAQLAACDRGGKFTAALPALIVASSGMGPLFSGWLFSDSYMPVLLFCGGSVVLALAFMGLAHRKAMLLETIVE